MPWKLEQIIDLVSMFHRLCYWIYPFVQPILQRATTASQSQPRRNHSVEIDKAAFQEPRHNSEPAEDADVRPVSETAASPSTSFQVQCEPKDQQRMREEWAATYIQTAFRGFLV